MQKNDELRPNLVYEYLVKYQEQQKNNIFMTIDQKSG